MYAVIKTGGKQYRVKAGDVLVVEKLAGDPGAKVAFDQVLMLGDGAGVTIGAPTVVGAVVSATLVETRKGEKIKVFKKIRRQGYRRTGGHRQIESVLRVTAIAGAGKSETWDGEVDLTPRSVLNARARGLAARVADAPVATQKPAPAETAKPAKAPVKAEAAPETAAPAKKAAPKAKAAPEAKAPVAAAPAKKTAAPKAKAAPEAKAPAAKKPVAKKAKPAKGDDA